MWRNKSMNAVTQQSAILDMQYTPLMTDAQERCTTGKSTVWEYEIDEGNAELGMGGEQFQWQDVACARTKEYKSLSVPLGWAWKGGFWLSAQWGSAGFFGKTS